MNNSKSRERPLPQLANYYGDVPCDGCRLCCIGDAVRLLKNDFLEDGTPKYKTEPHPLGNTYLMIAHKENTECIYLDEEGCTVHADKPQMCSEMDCRNIASNVSFTQARQFVKKGMLRQSIWEKGKELIKAEDINKKTKTNN